MSKVVIFDMDGVLIDSEPAYHEMNKKLFKDLGIDMNSLNYYEFVGMSSIRMWTLIKDKFKLNHDVEKLIGMERDLMHEILNSSISEPIGGIENLLNELRARKFIISLASSSAKENVLLVLNKLNLLKYFRFIVSGEEVDKGKPEPDIFLKVADKFNAVPAECFVIEDSTNGIRAAKAAGMKCIGFRNPSSGKQDLSGSDLIVENFDKESLCSIIEFMDGKMKDGQS